MKKLLVIFSVMALASFGCNRSGEKSSSVEGSGTAQEQQGDSRMQNSQYGPNASERFDMGPGSSNAVESDDESSMESDKEEYSGETQQQ